jgi:dTDP-glucose pyrophosphorylase
VIALVVTMAGESRRFREAGYTVPKHRLKVDGRSLLSWSLESLRAYVEIGARLILVGRADDQGLPAFAAAECRGLGFPAPTVVTVERPTSGQAETVLAAAPHVAPGERLVIFNIDTHVRPGAMGADTLLGDGCIPCFAGAGDAWSFAACDGAGRVTAVAEKQRISDHASVGLYAFRDLAMYREAYAATPPSVNPAGGRRERFVAPLYDTLVRAGHDIRLTVLAAGDVVPLGTPAEAVAAGTLVQPAGAGVAA